MKMAMNPVEFLNKNCIPKQCSTLEKIWWRRRV